MTGRSDAKGRVVAAEIMTATKTVEEHIKQPEKTAELKDVIERGRDQYGMQSFDQHLTELYKAGTIELDVAKAAASNPSDFERALNFSDTSGGDPNEQDDEIVELTFANEQEEKPEVAADSLFEGDDSDSLELDR